MKINGLRSEEVQKANTSAGKTKKSEPLIVRDVY